MSTCPECGKEYSPQGMWGHLSMGHDLDGEELERAYQKSKAGGEKPGRSARKPRSRKGKRPQELPEKVGGSGKVAAESKQEEGRLPALPASASGPAGGVGQDEGQTLSPVPETTQNEEGKASSDQLPSLPEVEENESPFMADVRKKLDELASARMRYQTALEATDPVPESREGSTESRGFSLGNGAVSQMLFGGESAEESSQPKRSPAARKLVQDCRKEVERCERQLAQSLDHADLEVQQPEK